MLGNLIGGMITIVIGASLMPIVAESVYASYMRYNVTNSVMLPNNNVSATAATVVSLLTLFYALGVMSTGIAIAVSGLKQAGIM